MDREGAQTGPDPEADEAATLTHANPNHTFPGRRQAYQAAVAAMQSTFEETLQQSTAGKLAVRARSRAVDALIGGLWVDALAANSYASGMLALVAVGGYGREELFPYSDVDLLFLVPARAEQAVTELIRQLSQQMWDAGLRLAPMTRTVADCERFHPENVEFTLALLDARLVTGDPELFHQLQARAMPKLIERDRKRMLKRLAEVTAQRHARYGDTLFHLEPNMKDCPGGLRDAHVFGWLRRLVQVETAAPEPAFAEARAFLLQVRVFLHLRYGRDSNVLDWHAQDQAAACSLGLSQTATPAPDVASAPDAPDAAYWMRVYFRHARSIQRTESLLEEEVAPLPVAARLPLLRLFTVDAGLGYELIGDRLRLKPEGAGSIDLRDDPACDPEVMLNLFGVMAQTGARLAGESAHRLEGALPLLSSRLEDGNGLWLRLRRILLGRFAGRALRSMHQLGILELVLPEFHGIDALVIRDAYHRYTVDEHTFVLIDTLHALEGIGPTRGNKSAGGLEPLRARFAAILRELPHPELLYLAALLHDTGKAHAGQAHAAESARMAKRFLGSLGLEVRDAGLVLGLIRHHLEMSASLRRDVFDRETVRSFAAHVPTPESLRMLTLFTYADISAVHPDALTPWKAENLLTLHNNTAQYLDRLVDDQRLGSLGGINRGEDDPEVDLEIDLEALLSRVAATLPGRRAEVDRFLTGLPRRYLLTRGPGQVRNDVEMARIVEGDAPAGPQLALHYAGEASELTVITRDRSMLFADIAGTLAAWGMNIVTANAFSNAHNLVVDTFRFVDSFHTLELNESERDRFLASVRDVVGGAVRPDTLLAGHRRGGKTAVKVKVSNRIDIDGLASSHSTLLQVVAQDTSGLLYAIARALSEAGFNIDVALIDTEGETAIDVFYVTQAGCKLDTAAEQVLQQVVRRALDACGR